MSTCIVYTPDFLDTVSNASIVVDTCVMIDALSITELDDFMRVLLEHECTFLSVPPVKNEFLTIAKTSQKYDELNEYIKSLQLTFLPLDIENRLNREGKSFNFALRRSRVKNPSYVDRLLLSIPCLYRTSPETIFLLTSNHKDVPMEFYNRVGFITIDKGIEFSQIGLYEFNRENFEKIIKNI